MPELQEVPCGVTPRATPHELQLIVRVNFEQQNVIAGCEAPALVMNKPFVAMYSRENEASAGQPSVDPFICDLSLAGPGAAGYEGSAGGTGGKAEGKAGSEKVAATSAGQEHPRVDLRPNLDRLTVGVDLGDQWSHYCILGLEGETLAEGQVRTRQQDVAEFFQGLNATRVVVEVDTLRLGAGGHLRLRARSAGSQSPVDGGLEAPQAEE